MNDNIQRCCEILEGLLDMECKQSRLSHDEFNAINELLFELQYTGQYKLPEKYNSAKLLLDSN